MWMRELLKRKIKEANDAAARNSHKITVVWDKSNDGSSLAFNILHRNKRNNKKLNDPKLYPIYSIRRGNTPEDPDKVVNELWHRDTRDACLFRFFACTQYALHYKCNTLLYVCAYYPHDLLLGDSLEDFYDWSVANFPGLIPDPDDVNDVVFEKMGALIDLRLMAMYRLTVSNYYRIYDYHACGV